MKGRSSSRKHHLRKKGHEEQEKKVNGPNVKNLPSVQYHIKIAVESIYFISLSSHRSNYH